MAGLSSAVSETAVSRPADTARTRSPGRLAWGRFRRDRLAVAAGAYVVLVLLAAALAPLICRAIGVDTQRHIELLSLSNLGFPDGRLGGASWAHPLGIEPKTGRDLLALLLIGSRTSLVIAFGATLVSVALGIVFGLWAGYFGGWVDTVISRSAEVLMAFPVLLFSIALLAVLGNLDRIGPLSGNGLRMAILIFVIGFFSFPYTARLMRSQVLSLRTREFVAAAKVMGATHRRILVRELLPNLTGPVIVVTSLSVPTTILAEAGLSFLGVGITPPATSWGQLLGAASRTFVVDPAYMLFPGVSMVATVLAFNLLGDGIRDAFDPKSRS
ncbi:ABC transporter permease [Kribbella sp. CA-245084]|uniref:ABC transporter permease n=1 Tax=Kribbella sp. CA-245084 TaxID=3239940 RepID=UPI003D93FCC7